jgi:UDP-N-acetylglucosamine 2-epimerase
MSYKTYLQTVYDCKFIISDSGTAQEEPALFKIPVLVPRDFTERPLSYHTFCSRKLCLDSLSVSNDTIDYLDTAEQKMNPKWLGSGDTSVKILKNIING